MAARHEPRVGLVRRVFVGLFFWVPGACVRRDPCCRVSGAGGGLLGVGLWDGGEGWVFLMGPDCPTRALLLELLLEL